MARRTDTELLLAQLDEDGTPRSQRALKEALEWDEFKFLRVRAKLIESGEARVGKGRGGSLMRTIAANPEGDGELQLYEPIAKTLRTYWAQDRGIQPEHLWLDITAKQGAKRTGGVWTRPDITLVAQRSYKYLPGKHLEVHTFEVKRSVDVLGIYEAAAHRRSATHSYAVFRITEADADILRTRVGQKEHKLTRCIEEGERLGVGVITFVDPSDFEKWWTDLDPEPHQPAPEFLNDFIETQLSPAGRDRVIAMTK